MVAVHGYAVELGAPEGARIQCDGPNGCPEGFECREALGRCVPATGVHSDPPAVGTFTVSTPAASVGRAVVVSFEVSEPLLDPPLVEIDLSPRQPELG